MTACPRGWTIRIPLLPRAAGGVGLDHGLPNCVLAESLISDLLVAFSILEKDATWKKCDDNAQLFEPSFARILARNLRP